MGAVGTITAVVMSSDAALKAKKVIEVEEFKKQNEEFCNKYLPEDVSKNATSDELIDIMKQRNISENEFKNIVKYDGSNSKLSRADKAVIYIKCYAPTAIMTAASIF